MKKYMVISVGLMLSLSSCGTYTAQGAYTGSTFGSIIGSAIGGITGGPRGHDVGTLVGMAGGAVVGAAIGQAADNAQQKKYEDYKAQRQTARNRQQASTDSYSTDSYSTNSGYDGSNSGDDRLYGFDDSFGRNYTGMDAGGSLQIRHAQLLDESRDGVLQRGEEARMVFEIYNNSDRPVYRVQPFVAEASGNKHIHISENILVESIPAHKGIRYTASIRADRGLKKGESVIRIGVRQNNHPVDSQTREFRILTSK